MEAKNSEVRVGVTRCSHCGRRSEVPMGPAEALCRDCARLTKAGAISGPTLHQAPFHLSDRLSEG